MSEAAAAASAVREIGGRRVPPVGAWTIDPAHSKFEFVARHVIAKVRGRFPRVSGVATIAEVPEASALQLEIDASTVDTKDPNRDAHLRSSEFFGIEEHPTISFRSTAVRPGDGVSDWLVDGELTVRGVPRPVTVEVEFLGANTDSRGNQRIKFFGVVPEVNREDWGLVWQDPLEAVGFLLASGVRLEIEAQLVRKS